MSTDEFTKRWDNVNGFTIQEAEEKQAKVNAAYGVGTSRSKWNPAEIVQDGNKRSGFKVVITTKV